MEELLKNMNLVHTTPMGVDRIRKNIGLDNNTDPVEYCKSLILSADSIIRNGKNYYATKENIVVTVNAYSYTIITAHKVK